VAAILKEKPRAPREVNPRISSPLEALIEKATDKEPGLRYQTAKELLVDLERLAAGQSAPPSKPVGRRTWRALAVAASLVLAVPAAAWLLRPREPRITAFRTLSQRPFPLAGIATDGESVYFVEGRVPTDALVALPLSGGEAREWPVPWTGAISLRVLDFQKSPPSVLVRKTLGVPGMGELWRFPLPSGTPSRVGDLKRIRNARLSNEGDRLAYVQMLETGGRDGLFVADLEGSRPRRIAEGPTPFILDGWVPGDERISYHTTSPAAGFWEARADGAGPARPVEVPLETFDGPTEWCPDGSFLLQGGRSLRAHRVRRPFWLRPQPPGELSGPADIDEMRFTPDGRRIVALVQQTATTIVRFDAQTREFSALLGRALAGVLTYSPDGRWVAWVAHDGRAGRLLRSRPDGTEAVSFGGAGELALSPGVPVRWSPDGRHIAFSSWLGSTWGLRLYLGDATNATFEPLTADPGGQSQVDACWSPDGRSLVYAQLESGDDPRMALWRIEIASRAVTRIAGGEGLWSPKCAPDGRILAYDRVRQREDATTDRQFLKLWEPARQQWTAFSVPLWPVNYPNWSRDGRYVYAMSSSGGRKKIVRFEVPTGRVETVLPLEGAAEVSQWMDLAPDGDLLFHRDASSRELVVMEWEAR
jgi:hypothetical protein